MELRKLKFHQDLQLPAKLGYKPPMRIFYCTNEPENPVDIEEIHRLEATAKVTVVSSSETHIILNGSFVKVRMSLWIRRLIQFWLQICILFARLPNNSIATRFPERNVYKKTKLVTGIINVIWTIKIKPSINIFLPNYSTLALFPFRFAALFSKRNGFSEDVVIYNSLFINVIDFMFFLTRMRKSGAKLIANVRSWDNPYYIQFDSAADYYLTWSEHMDRSIEQSQILKSKSFIHWGPNQFRKFWQGPASEGAFIERKGEALEVGYAAAFGDSIITFAEYNYICDLAVQLRNEGVNLRILYRPYPTVDPQMLISKRREESVIVCGINSQTSDRYGDGREIIRFGSHLEKKAYLNSCDVFLSIGTTFTAEAFLHGTPIIHFYLPEKERIGEDAILFFKRIEITCVHFFDYFPGAIPFVESIDDLRLTLLNDQSKSISRETLLERLGIEELGKIVFLPLATDPKV